MKKLLAVLTLACLLTGCAAGVAGGNVYETKDSSIFDRTAILYRWEVHCAGDINVRIRIFIVEIGGIFAILVSD